MPANCVSSPRRSPLIRGESAGVKNALSLFSEALLPKTRSLRAVSRGPLLARVELDVASTRPRAAQVATGQIIVGQLDLEYVVAAGLALVAYSDSGCAWLTIDRNSVVDDTTSR